MSPMHSDHGVSLLLYAKDPDGPEFEIFWPVPGGISVPTREVDLEGELAGSASCPWMSRRCGA